MGKKFYSYYIPETEEIGIVDNWKDCFNKVSGTKAKYKSFLTYQEAKMWLNYMISPDTAPLPTPLFSSKKNQKFYGCYFIKEDSYEIYNTWEECARSVEQFRCRYKSFKTYEEAETWCKNGAVYVTKETIKKELPEGIYFDAGTGRGNGVESKVSFKDGKSILPKFFPEENINEFGNLFLGTSKTNNYGELKALDLALDIALKENILNIFGDSALVIDYWSKGHIKNDMDYETKLLSKQVTEKRLEFESLGGTITKISGDYNPADLGFHR